MELKYRLFKELSKFLIQTKIVSFMRAIILQKNYVFCIICLFPIFLRQVTLYHKSIILSQYGRRKTLYQHNEIKRKQ